MAVRRVQQLAKEIGLPEFRSLGVRPEDLDELAEHATRNGSNRDNPRPMEKSDYLCLLKTLMNQK
jgi:alcohol dehydrogenase